VTSGQPGVQPGEPRLLGKAELLGLLRRADAIGARPGAADLDGGLWTLRNELFRSLPFWAASAGLLEGPAESGIVLYLGAREGLPGYFPSVLVLDLAVGRYSVRTWDVGRSSFTGSEIATASPLVCGPPCDGSDLVIRITRP